MGNDDENLPWQYSILGLMWFGALVMGCLLKLAWSPGWFPSEVRADIRKACLIYLGITVPILFLTGRRK